jgi:predicted SAM-dependent methyltransferase
MKRRSSSWFPVFLLALPKMMKAARPRHVYHCPICGYHGYFAPVGRPPRLEARCRQCGSKERHRLFWLWFAGQKDKLAEPIVHFAPEVCLTDRLRAVYPDYRTADRYKDADLKLDIEAIDLPAGSVNTIICNHVLEHVADRAALKELARVLSPTGTLICSVPIVEGWETTYENDAVTTPEGRELHFGQKGHVRYYGRDFRDRLREAGFTRIEEITAEGPAVVEYGLWRGEKFFICRKE